MFVMLLNKSFENRSGAGRFIPNLKDGEFSHPKVKGVSKDDQSRKTSHVVLGVDLVPYYVIVHAADRNKSHLSVQVGQVPKVDLLSDILAKHIGKSAASLTPY